MTLCSMIGLFVFCTIPIVESLRCSRSHQFEHRVSDSFDSFNFSSLKNESNNTANERCVVRLTINYNSGHAGGFFLGGISPSTIKRNSDTTIGNLFTTHVEDWFNADNQSFVSYDALHIITLFYLNNDTTYGHFIYQCSMNDYCDIDFLREILSTSLPTEYVASFRKDLTTRLYDRNKNIPLTCFNISRCPNSAPLCSRNYSRNNGQFGYQEKHHGICINSTQFQPMLRWYQVYTKSEQHQQINTLAYDCNIPNCGSNQTSKEIIQMLTNQYRLPYNNSIIHMIKPPRTTSTLTSSSVPPQSTSFTAEKPCEYNSTQPQSTDSTRTTTRKNYASNINAQLYFIVSCFVITIFFSIICSNGQ